MAENVKILILTFYAPKERRARSARCGEVAASKTLPPRQRAAPAARISPSALDRLLRTVTPQSLLMRMDVSSSGYCGYKGVCCHGGASVERQRSEKLTQGPTASY